MFAKLIRSYKLYYCAGRLAEAGRCVSAARKWSSAVRFYQTSTSSSDRSTSINHERSYRARRAVMYVPASDERKLSKIPSLGADTIVLDLEDGVAANKKEEARRNLDSALLLPRPASECVVRVNDVNSGLMANDLWAVFSCQTEPDALMLPKCESLEQLKQLDFQVGFYRGPKATPISLSIIIESPSALLLLRDICGRGMCELQHLKLEVVVLGADDFLASLGGRKTDGASELVYARQSFVTIVKSFGLQAIDLVSIDYQDLEALRLQSEEGAYMGFTGKQVIHPLQVPVVHSAFTPSRDLMDWANGLIAAFSEHQASGKGAFTYRGKMIDRPLLLQAQNIVNMAQSINSNTVQ